MNKRVEEFLAKISTPEFQEKYLEKTAPEIARIFGTTGERRNKRHDPKNLGGTICPICAIKGCNDKRGADFLKQDIEKVTTTRIGKIIEDCADYLVLNMLKNYQKNYQKKRQESSSK